MKYLIQRLDKIIVSFTSYIRYFLILVFVLLTFSTNINQKPIVASYDVEPELFWLKKYGIYNLIEDNLYSSSVYYESSSQKFYFATIEKTNNISYNTNNITDEKAFILHTACWGAKPNPNNTDLIYYPIEDPLIYVGSIDFTNRIYIDTNNTLYIKKLIEIDTSYYVDYNDNKQAQKGDLFPYLEETKRPTLALSNQFEEYFVIGNMRPNTDINAKYPNGTIYLKHVD